MASTSQAPARAMTMQVSLEGHPRVSQSPFGPASAPINAREFIPRAQDTHERALSRLAEWNEVLARNPEIAKRCHMINTSREQSEQLLNLDHAAGELERRQRRVFRPDIIRIRIDNAKKAAAEGGADKKAGSGKRARSKSTAGRGGSAEPGTSADGGAANDDEEEDGGGDLASEPGINEEEMPTELRQLLEEAKTSELKIIHSPQNISYYIRQTRISDQNTILDTRLAPELSPDAGLADWDPELSNVVLEIFFHPMQRAVQARQAIATRSQRLVVLGSTTLFELQQALVPGNEIVPAQRVDAQGNMFWIDERRHSGSVFLIEDVMHEDATEGISHYGQILKDYFDSGAWTENKSSQRGQRRTIHHVLQNPDGTFNKPEWALGTSMQQTRIGDLLYRERVPYWFLHEGNCEHFFTIESTRLRVPSDPEPFTEAGARAYPISTFVSRMPSSRVLLNKCRICDRDPGSIITVDDEMAGETPAFMCQPCFNLLHPDPVADGVKVLPMYLDRPDINNV